MAPNAIKINGKNPTAHAQSAYERVWPATEKPCNDKLPVSIPKDARKIQHAWTCLIADQLYIN